MQDRRSFSKTLAASGVIAPAAFHTAAVAAPAPAGAEHPDRLEPIGEGKGIHPGRVVWAHDPKAIEWKGPGDGHWWEGDRLKQDRLDAMMARAVCGLTGAATVAEAWSKLFRHLNKARGKGDAAYRPGEKIAIKPNWVGMIWREGIVDPKTYTFMKRQDYMNVAPQMVLALLKQLTRDAGVKPSDITVCDTLAYLVHEYYGILHKGFPEVRYEDYAGKFGRVQVKTSKTPLYWSIRPKDKAPDFLPTCFAEAEYVVNFAAFKAHQGSGVTLSAKNHFGSLVRWPAQEGYYDIHPNCFSDKTAIYRPLVDVMGHAHLGGKTVLYLIDGLFTGVHPRDPEPSRMKMPPFNGRWPSSLFASQDPVAIDSVAYDFLWAERTDFPRKGGVDDYLHEAALAADPPSGSFYDPDHATPTRRLASLGVHEHWTSAAEKKYSRNLGKPEGIELVAVG